MLTSNWGSNYVIMVMRKTINQRNEPELQCFQMASNFGYLFVCVCTVLYTTML